MQVLQQVNKLTLPLAASVKDPGTVAKSWPAGATLRVLVLDGHGQGLTKDSDVLVSLRYHILARFWATRK